jgi:predicted nucleic acid-binding protein
MIALSGKLLVDTSVLIYATLSNDPRHATASGILALAGSRSCQPFVSTQNLAEMYPNLTGPKVKPPDSPEVARSKIQSIGRLRGLEVIPITSQTVDKALELCQKYNVRCQDYFDMQLVAAMMLHGIPTIVTENAQDFAPIREIRVINPF